MASLTRLEVDGFRNLGHQSVAFGGGLNLVVGENGQGKTNLLEAVYLLGYQTSFRTATREPLVAMGAEEARLAGEVVQGGARLRLHLSLPRRGPRRCILDGATATAAESLAACPVVLFSPDDLSLVRGPAAARRGLLDRALAVHDPAAVAVMRRYRQLLRQRNQLLRRAAEAGVEAAEHATWEEALALAGAELRAVRERYVAAWGGVAAAVLEAISSFPVRLEIQYNAAPAEGSDGEERAASLAAALAQRRGRDLRLGTTSIGPHRDDLLLTLGDLDCRRYASQGQARAVAIALRIAQVTLFRDTHGTTPILLLDDLFAELDGTRRERLAAFLAESGGQVVVTAVDGELPPGLEPERQLRMEAGQVA